MTLKSKFFSLLPCFLLSLLLQVIFGNRWRHLLGERDFWEHVGGIDVSIVPSSFGQANTRVSIWSKHYCDFSL